jgi:serine protease Do
MKQQIIRTSLIAMVATLAFIAHSGFTLDKKTTPAPKLNIIETPIARETKLATSFANVIKKVSPSVVSVYATKTVKENARMRPFFGDPRFRNFFGDQDEERPQRKRKEEGLGSGVIISADGYILSNNHVVEGADDIKVVLNSSKEEYPARVIGTDPQTEVALLKIEGKDLPAISITDSDKLEIGDVVLAVGNPFGVGQTVTMGIVSAVGRGGFGLVDYEDFIQTDASINPGNSGGALVDAEGRLVGLNTFIISRTGGSQGIGFAIPINMARSVMDRLLNDGKVVRGFLGVYIQEVTPELARAFKLPNQNGALIGGVSAKAPAAEAGIKEGDLVTEYNGKKVSDSRHLRLMVSQTSPRSKATVKLIRDGREKTVTVTLGELPTGKEVATKSTRSREREPKVDVLDGVEVGDLDNRTRRQLEVPGDVQGAIITRVASGSKAQESGLRPGDIIVEMDHQPVTNADQAVEISKKLKASSVLLRVWNEGGTRFAVVAAANAK